MEQLPRWEARVNVKATTTKPSMVKAKAKANMAREGKASAVLVKAIAAKGLGVRGKGGSQGQCSESQGQG